MPLPGLIPMMMPKKAGVHPMLLNDQYCKLLLHFDYTAGGGTTVIDAAMGNTAAHIFAVSGGTTQQTTDKKFGAASMAFGGTNADYAQTTTVPDDLNFGSGDFCIDFWAKRTDGQTTQKGLCGIAQSGLGDYSFWMDRQAAPDNVRVIVMFTDGSNLNVNGSAAAAMDAAWHHYAFERVGSIFTLYVDGLAIASGSSAKTIKAPAYKLGVGTYGEWVSNGNMNWAGWIDEFRISVGSARFFGNFAPPSAPYDVAPTNGNDAYTRLLLHFDGANGAQSGPGFVDSSLSAKGSATNAGGSGISTAQSKFGGSSFINARNGYCTMPNHADYNFGANDFTIDWWEYRSDVGAVISRDLPSNPSPFLVYNAGSGNLLYLSSNTSTWDIANAQPMNNNPGGMWFHQAVVRRANRFLIFLNGALYNTFLSSAALANNSNALCIGAAQNGLNMGGYTDELRISNVARWTGDFTPPAAPYSVNPP